MTASAYAQDEAVYEPSASDPRIVAALDAQRRLGDAMSALDIDAIETLMAPDLVVNAPVNKVVNRANVIERLKRQEIKYEGGRNVAKLEFAGVRGNLVIIMAEETVHPIANAPNAGKTVRRRSTDVWRNTDGVWRLAIRQATVVAVD
jgi:ketosteroid isomerase-like protein